MKYTRFLLFPLLLLSCHGNGHVKADGVDTTSDNTIRDSPVTVTKNEPKSVIHDTILWIGISARWKKTPQEIYDGSYDSLSSFFIPCGRSNTIKVPRDNIEFDLVSNCDTSLGSRIKLFDIIRGDSLPVILPHQLVLVNTQSTNQMAVQLRNGGHTITLKPSQSIRVKQAAALNKEIYIRKKLMTEGK